MLIASVFSIQAFAESKQVYKATSIAHVGSIYRVVGSYQNNINITYYGVVNNQYYYRVYANIQYFALRENNETQEVQILNSGSTTIDSTKNFKINWYYDSANSFTRIYFSIANTALNPNDYTGIGKLLATFYNHIINDTVSVNTFDTEMFVLIDQTCQISTTNIVTGQIGDVYQGLITNDGNIYSTISKYKYTLVNGSLQVSFAIQSSISGINYTDRGLILQYMLDKEEISIPADGQESSITYPFGTITIYNRTTEANSIAFFIYYNGTIYVNTSSPLYAFITAITMQAFDVIEFNDTQFIWATYANINQDIELSILNNQLVIIELLENGETSAYQEFIDNFESAVSDENIPPIDISAENSYFESVWAAHEDDLTYYKSWFLTPLWNEWVIIEVITAALFLGFISYIIFGKKA